MRVTFADGSVKNKFSAAEKRSFDLQSEALASNRLWYLYTWCTTTET
ncbi:MAG: hypothetical protein R3C49_21700 [Planctomycetaceae bacterium]